ncbi:bifunctional hydroxymethylpyrimidine kinase/phosphomethylpyrimidine kinase [Giesbergeria sp.]|uniref:bifunctional hydroxymethylpyrimidine kinase/phosphomethylpyrimidine kinase n=1 Tax=Giesbergeria sp. TaxID=2818473 RepID=UPI0026348ADB|nr:bifunctional hydroxymethylpyrimidine kinase/phosphomethylpyrimidine kinase [Giesbergeria sp.]
MEFFSGAFMSSAALPTSSGFRYVRILSIAGSDSGGGAGIQADLKTFSALGCYGMTAITAITAQNTQGVRAIHGVPPEMLRAQIAAVVEDIGVDAIKIGMLHSPEVVQVVADAIDHCQLAQVVLDPVMVATSGDRLMASETVQVLIEKLFPRVQVITPNLDEAALLLGQPIEGAQALASAAQALLGLGAPAVLLKGGHLAGDAVVDVLAQADGHLQRWTSARIVTANSHGTGCTLSAALAVYLALGHALPEAVALARSYILGALAAGAAVHTGRGHGPLNHAYAPVVQQVRAC